MPTYSYRCTECGHAFDIQQSFSDDSLTVCPSCGGVLRKIFSPVGVTFNGSGFYRTDSRSGSKAQGAGSAGGSSSDGAAASKPAESKPADSKPAAAPKPAASSGSTPSS